MIMKSLVDNLPTYPRTPHIPYLPNISAGDIVGTEKEVSFLFNSPNLVIEEKIDGSNSAAMLCEDGNVIIRNRDHILNKGYLKATPSKIQ